MIKLSLKLNAQGEFFPSVSLNRLVDTERRIWAQMMEFRQIVRDPHDTLLFNHIHDYMTEDVEIHIDGLLEGLAHSIAHSFLSFDTGTDVGFDDEGAPYLATLAGMFQTKGGEHYITIYAR